MGAGERRVWKMEPLRIDCLPFTWANLWVHGLGKWWAKFRTGKLLPESRLPFVQISSLYRKTAAKAWNWYQRWLWRNGTRISVWNIPSRKNGTTFSGVPLLPDSFHWNNPKAVFHLLSIRIFRNLFVNGKQPLFSIPHSGIQAPGISYDWPWIAIYSLFLDALVFGMHACC